MQTVRFCPLRADGGGKRFGGGFIMLRFANSGAQRLQHFAIGFVFDALRQRGGLYCGAVQDAFNRGGIRFTTEGGADLLRHGSAGAGVLQAVLFLPLRADGGGERFGGGFVALCIGDSGAQRLQHFAVGFVPDTFRQRGGLHGGAVQDAFDGRRIRFTAQCGADLLGDGSAGAGVLQAVLFLPLRADGGGKRFGSGFVALCVGNAGAQRLQHFAIGFVLDAFRQRGSLYRSAAQNTFDGRRIGFTTEGGADLLRHGSSGAGVLQTVLFLPLRADGRGERFGGGFVALCSTNSGAQRLQHFTVGFVFDALRQRGGLDGGTVQDAFDGRGVRFTTEGGADLLRDGSAGAGILQ